jgi:hypothetical protein
METSRYRVFGLELESDFALPGLATSTDDDTPMVSLRIVRPPDAAACWSGSTDDRPMWKTVIDDSPVRVERGAARDYQITYGERAVFWLSSDGRTLLCGADDPTDVHWQRFLLDTVLGSTSLLRGFEALHASAVEQPDGVVAFATITGGGKSSLAAELVRRGHPLFCDDILALKRRGDRVVGYPGPPLMNLPVGNGRQAIDELGDPLATFGDEAWVAVRNASSGPRPLIAVCLLDRRPGLPSELVRLSVTPLHLLPHSLGFALPGRAETRFTMFGELAHGTPVFRLRSDPSTEPAALADLVEEVFPQIVPAGAGS